MTEPIFPAVIERFIQATNMHSFESLFGVFAEDATVIDDGTIYATVDELRSWIEVHQIAPKIVIAPISFEHGRLAASVDGEFPGGPLNFMFTFTIQDEAITRLEIKAL